MKNKKYMKWAGVLIAVMFLATMIPANAVDSQFDNQATEELSTIRYGGKPNIEYELSDVPEDVTAEMTFEPIFTGDIDKEGYENPPPWNRRSFFYVTPYTEEIDGFNRVLGLSWHMLMWGDGTWHWFNVTGLYEVYFLDGTFRYNENWIMHLHHWAPGQQPFPYNWQPSHLTWTWWYNYTKTGLQIDYIHICQDHTEDDVYIRTVDRTWWGRWEIPGNLEETGELEET